MNQKIEELLNRTKKINAQSEELRKLKGENFNVFRIFNLESSETKLHSTFIAELLSPNGSHGMGERFFKEFVRLLHKELDLPLFPKVVNSDIQVNKEVYLGPVNFFNNEGGFLDILIKTERVIIGVENKIYSGEGHKQLRRYKKHLDAIIGPEQKFLLYLTLDGSLPNDINLEKNKDYYCISYSNFILPWIKSCHEIAADAPILRETIKQYILLVQNLTNQLTSHEMEKELEDLIYKNYSESKKIASKISMVQLRIMEELYENVISHLNEKLGEEWELHFSLSDLEKDWHNFSVRNRNWIEGLTICFEGTPKLSRGFSYGILFKSELNNKEELKKKFGHQIKFRKVHNNWLTHSAGEYNNLIHQIDSTENINKLSNDVSNYIMQKINKESQACELIHNYYTTERNQVNPMTE